MSDDLRENLGKSGKNILTGDEGIVISRGKFLYGCDKYGILVKKDEKDVEKWICDSIVKITDDYNPYESKIDKEKLDEPLVLGSEVEDKVTGFKGILTGREVSLFDCDSYQVTPKADKNEYKDSMWLDVGRLIITKKQSIKVEDVSTERTGSCEVRSRW